ncbi:sensor domain-containing protein [Pleionea sediminis]|uniref:sensor domain-containing protein n=1 Tax=Pleionea sediminis TaxID=2569479 RepID=UPI0011871880|nr:bifunctional diguanylate cyclase/phosphodiesterase [Pleionea sediminis]
MNKSGFNLITVFIFVALMGATLSFLIFRQSEKVDSNNKELLQMHVPLLQSVYELGQSFTEHERILYEFYSAENLQDYSQNLKANYSKFNQNLNNIENHGLPEETIIKISHAHIQFKDIADKLRITMLEQPYPQKYDTARRLLKKMTSIGNEARSFLVELSNDIKHQVAISQKKSSQTLNNMSTFVLGFSVVIVSFMLFGGVQIRTQLKEAKEKKRLALFLEQNPNPVASIYPNGDIDYKNPAWKELEHKIDHAISFAEFEKIIFELDKENKNYKTWQMNIDEKYFLASLHKQDNFSTFTLYLEDITHRRKAEKELAYLAFNDPLTELPNRRKMETDLDEWAAEYPNYPIATVVIGIDRFSQVTASHGFKVGDQIILSIRDRIFECVHILPENAPIFRLYRFTGAKFVLLIQERKQDSNIRAWTQKIVDDIQSSMLKFIANTHGHFYLHLTFGAAYYPLHSDNISKLVPNADNAYTIARRSGGNQCLEFDISMAEKERQWLDMEVDLRVAQNKHQFYLLYQPKVESTTGKLKGVEALLRWEHPDKGLISPAEFIPVAEQSGLIIEIGEWIIDEACRQTRQWLDQGISDIVCAVNISPLQFLHHNFLHTLETALSKNNLPPQNLELEITEGVLMHDVDNSIGILNQLHQQNIKLSIDDFGTGYSSLSYLKSFSLDKLKIDKSFVDNITSNNADRSIIQTVIHLAKHLGLTVIAEGVETKEQLDYLIEYGCDEIQGYYFSKPLPAEKIIDFSPLRQQVS